MVHATVSAPVGWCKPSTVPYIRMKSSWRMTHGGFCLAGGRGQCHPCSIAIKHLLIAGSMHKMPQIASTSQSTPSLSLDPLQNAGVPVCILATYVHTYADSQTSSRNAPNLLPQPMQLHSYDSGNQYSHKGETEVHTDCLASQTTTMLALPIGKNVQTGLQFCSVDPSMCHTTPKASTYIGGWV